MCRFLWKIKCLNLWKSTCRLQAENAFEEIGDTLMSGSLIEWGKEKLKWGKIISAQDYFGEKFSNKFDYSFSCNIVDKYLETDELYKAMKICQSSVNNIAEKREINFQKGYLEN